MTGEDGESIISLKVVVLNLKMFPPSSYSFRNANFVPPFISLSIIRYCMHPRTSSLTDSYIPFANPSGVLAFKL